MAIKEFTFRGYKTEDLKKLPLGEFLALIPSRARRSAKRGFTEDQKKLLEKIRAHDNDIKTHARDMIILPEMIGVAIKVYNGKEFMPVHVVEDMVGHIIGEFAPTRRRVAHSAPGVGATKSSSSVSVR
ncbi:MAG: 30S ribosomal protein S19 [Nanoarchaeota archaeon]|nr:30S ribosomal protein S19 [Nanoarchaeota archaeon]